MQLLNVLYSEINRH